MSRYAQITASAASAITAASTTDRTPWAETSIPKNFIVILGIGRTFPFKTKIKVVLLAASQYRAERLSGQRKIREQNRLGIRYGPPDRTPQSFFELIVCSTSASFSILARLSLRISMLIDFISAKAASNARWFMTGPPA